MEGTENYMMHKGDSIFGIPITSGKLLSSGEHGFVVSFNFDHLLLETLICGQIFSSNQEPLSKIVPTTKNLINLFQYPLLSSSPNISISQKAKTVIVFIKTPKFEFSSRFRIVLWFTRNPIPVKKNTDFIDVPNEGIPLFLALVKQQLYNIEGTPVPEELKNEIKKYEDKIIKKGNPENYYFEDTFNLTQTAIDKMSQDSIDESEIGSHVFTDDELDELLKGLDLDLTHKRKGAWETFNSDNDDRLSQSANSIVELLDQVIGIVSKGITFEEFLKNKFNNKDSIEWIKPTLKWIRETKSKLHKIKHHPNYNDEILTKNLLLSAQQIIHLLLK